MADKMTGAELLVKALEAEGVHYVFALPGEENLDLLEAMRNSSLELIVTRHEQGAGFMAATIGRLTGKVAVCMSTLGPGATNLMTPAAFAQLGGMPLLLITGQKPVKRSKQGAFQVIDTVEMFRPLSKYTKQLISAEGVVPAVRQALKHATEERPGTVHLELPEDIAVEEADSALLGQMYPLQKLRRPAAEAKAIALAVEKIKAAKHPLLLIGAGANRKLTAKMLQQFVDKTGIPFFNTQMGKGVIPEDHPLYLGTAALSSGDFLHCAVSRADLIINVGHDTIEKPPFVMGDGSKGTSQAEVVHVNFYPAQVDRVYFPQLEVVGDVANAIWQLQEALAPQAHWDFEYFLRVRAEIQAHVSQGADSEAFPVWPQRVVAEMRKQMPADGILALDNGMYKLWFARNYPALAPNTLLLDNALATMGAGLPTALASKLLYPERKVVAICGDGGFLMNSQELETAKRLGLAFPVVILRDNGYGMIKWKQEAAGLANYGLDLQNPDFVKLAESYGHKGVQPKSAAEFASALAEALASDTLTLIDVEIDYTHNHRVFTEELSQHVCLV